MTPSGLSTLRHGEHYYILIRGQKRRTRRIFKWLDLRRLDAANGIPCAVFTAPVSAAVVATYYPGMMPKISFSGPRVPRSEVSIPHYDILECSQFGV